MHAFNPIEAAIEKFKHHPSIAAIKKNVSPTQGFDFDFVSREHVKNQIRSLNPKKKGTFAGIPSKILKLANEESSKSLTEIWNRKIVSESLFPEELKLADVTPVFKKNDSTKVQNYRPISVLPTVSKAFERLMHEQVARYMIDFFQNICVVIEKDIIPRRLFYHFLKNGKIC